MPMQVEIFQNIGNRWKAVAQQEPLPVKCCEEISDATVFFEHFLTAAASKLPVNCVRIREQFRAAIQCTSGDNAADIATVHTFRTTIGRVIAKQVRCIGALGSSTCNAVGKGGSDMGH